MNTKPTQILLNFGDKETVDYINLVCRRKCIDLEDYILDNFEWDDKLPCMDENDSVRDDDPFCCVGCDYAVTCPDAYMDG